MTKSKKPLMVIFLTVFIDLLGFGIVIPLLGRYGKRLEVGDWTIGLLMCSFSAMQFLFAPIWGRISDRVGRRPILILGLAGSTIFYALFGVASAMSSLALLFVSRIGAGMSGATIGIAQAYIADSTPPEKRSSGMALIGAAFGLGFTLGPMIGGLALAFDKSEFSPLPGYFASALSCMAMLMAIFVLPESLTAESRAAERTWFNFGHFRKALAMPGVGALILVNFVALFAFAQFEGTLARITEPAFGLDDKHNYYLFTFIGVTLALAQGYFVRKLIKRLPDHRIALTGIVGLGLGLLGLAISIDRQSLAMMLSALFVLVNGFAFLNTAINSLISRLSSAQEQGGVLGVNQSASALARIFGPLIGNGLCIWGFAAPSWSGAGIMILALGLMLRIRPVVAVSSATVEAIAT